MIPGSAPLSLRLAEALASKDAGDADAPVPLRWTGAGSRVLAAARRLAPAIETVSRPFETMARALAARPLLLVAAAALAAPLSQMAGVPAAGIGAVALAGVALVLAAARTLHEGPERAIVFRAIVAGALLRLVFGFLVGAQGGFPDETGTYHPIAADAAVCWRIGGPATMAENVIVAGRAAYFHLLAWTYTLLGPSMEAGRLLGGLMGLAAALAVGEIGRSLGGRRAAALSVAVFALHPEHALWSITLSRDTLSALLVLVALAAVARRPGALVRGNALVVAIPLAILAMNSFLVAGALAATLVMIALAEAIVRTRGIGRVVAVALAGLVAVAALVVVGNRYGMYFTPETIATVRGHAIGMEADFLPSLEFESWWTVAAFLPLGAVFVLAAPWPWDAVHANRAAYGVLALAGLAIAVTGIAGLVATARRRPAAAAPIVLFCLILLVLLAMLEGNSGIVVRHRLPLTACLCAGAGALLAGLRREA